MYHFMYAKIVSPPPASEHGTICFRNSECGHQINRQNPWTEAMSQAPAAQPAGFENHLISGVILLFI